MYGVKSRVDFSTRNMYICSDTDYRQNMRYFFSMIQQTDPTLVLLIPFVVSISISHFLRGVFLTPKEALLLAAQAAWGKPGQL